MREDDLAAVKILSDRVHAGLPERLEVLADKRRMFPKGAFALEMDGTLVGYALAHPWVLGAMPALDALIGAAPEGADCLYLHDVAILPEARGHGSAREMIDMLAPIARAEGLAALALTSVYGTHDFWATRGFVECDAPGMEAKLASYGGPARYMVRAL